MKALRLLFILSYALICSVVVNAQTGLYLDNIPFFLKDNVSMEIKGDLYADVNNFGSGIYSGNPAEIYLDGNLTVKGSSELFAEGDFSHLIFKGRSEQTINILETAMIEFHKVSVRNPKNILLNSDIQINDTLYFDKGNIGLNSHHIRFVLNTGIFPDRIFGDSHPHPWIIGENKNSHFFGKGFISVQGDISSTLLDNHYDFANLGYSVRQPNLSNILIRRSQDSQLISDGESIKLSYDVITNAPLNGKSDIKVNVFENSLNKYDNIDELNFFSHSINEELKLLPDSTWKDEGIESIENYRATLDNIENLYPNRWTLYDCDNPEINLRASSEKSCLGDTIILTVDNTENSEIQWSTGESTESIKVSRKTEGNDTIIVVATLANGCYSEESIILSFKEIPEININTPIVDACIGTDLVLSPQYSDTLADISWSTGDTTQSIEYLVTKKGQEKIYIQASHGSDCIARDSIIINGLEDPEVDLGNDTLICNGKSLMLHAGAGDNLIYDWSPGNSEEESITVSESGDYAVVVRNSVTSCVSRDSISIGISSLFVTRKTEQPTCAGRSIGAVYLNIQSGTAPYKIRWSTGDTTQSIQNIPSGIYSVTIEDSLGCKKSFESIKITEPSPLEITSELTDDFCRAGNGEIILHPRGGKAPYSFVWKNSLGNVIGSNKDLKSLHPGSYSVDVMDTNNCIIVDTFEIQGPLGSFTYDTLINNIQCNNDNDGKIVLHNLSGGNPPYNFHWSNGERGNMIANLSAGSYSVTITDSENCTLSDSEFKVELVDDLQVLDSIVMPDCKGVENGKIYLRVVPSDNEIDFNWSTGDTEDSLVNLAEGIYSVTVTDNMGCSTIQSYELTGQEEQTHIIDSVIHVNCSELNSGGLFLSPLYQDRNFTYDWSHDGEDMIDNDSLDLENMSPGKYSITITEDNGCISTDTFEIIRDDTISQVAEIMYRGCGGNPTADVLVRVNGGQAPFIYNWSDGSDQKDLINVIPGSYQLSIEDNEGCLSMAEYTIDDIPELSLDIIQDDVRCSMDTQNVVVVISGGYPPYTLIHNNSIVSGKSLSVYPEGNYSLSLVDSLGCSKEFTVSLNELSEFQIDSEITHVSESGNSDGSIELSTEGGQAPFSYQWSNGESSSEINNLSEGEYFVTVSDASGCRQIMQYLIEVNPAFNLDSEIVYPDCITGEKGNIEIIVEGGNTPFTFRWSDGQEGPEGKELDSGNHNVTITDNSGVDTVLTFSLIERENKKFQLQHHDIICADNPSGKLKISIEDTTAVDFIIRGDEYLNVTDSLVLADLLKGIYSVSSSYGESCTYADTIEINSPDSLLIDADIDYTHSLIDNGSIKLNVSGGDYPYTYRWSNGSTGPSIENLSGGSYSVTVTDFSGCTQFRNYFIPEFTALNATADITPADCGESESGTIDLTINGGLEPYEIQWGTGDNSEDLLNISQGDYTVTVVDNGNKQIVRSYTVPEVDQLILDLESEDVSCQGQGSAEVLISGGVSPYTIQWSNGDTSRMISGLSAAEYSVIVTDLLGCSATKEVIIGKTEEISLSIDEYPETAIGKKDGLAVAQVTGGIAPYSYIWSNDIVNDSLINIGSGTYYLTVVDQNGCISMDSAMIELDIGGSNDLTIMVADSMKVSCKDGNDGSIDIEVAGGQMPYTYAWSSGDNTQDIENLVAGIYTVTVTDALDSIGIRAIQIEEPDQLALSVDSLKNTNCMLANGFISVSAFGGTMPYAYQWSNGTIEPVISDAEAGEYYLTITDANNCSIDTNFILKDTLGLSGDIVLEGRSCTGLDGTLMAIIENSTGVLDYEWNTGETTQSIDIQFEGEYAVTVSDDSGCEIVLDTIIMNIEDLDLEFKVKNIGCSGNEFGSITAAVSGGTPPYSYQWSQSDTSVSIFNLEVGEYHVTITDLNGCTVEGSAEITEIADRTTARFLAPSPVMADDTVQFIDLSYPKPDRWLWNFGDTLSTISAEEDPQFIYKNDTTKEETFHEVVLVVQTENCADTLSKVIRVIHSKSGEYIQYPELSPIVTQIEEFVVYPNPAYGEFYAAVVLNQTDDIQIRVFSATGKLIEKAKYDNSQSAKHIFTTERYSAGVYFISLTAGKDSQLFKIIVLND